MSPPQYPISTTLVCPACEQQTASSTDSSHLRQSSAELVLEMTCPHCQAVFEIDVLKGRTVLVSQGALSAEQASRQPEPPEPVPKPPPSPVSAKVQQAEPAAPPERPMIEAWTHGKAASTPDGFAPLLDDPEPPNEGAGAFAPLLDDPPAPPPAKKLPVPEAPAKKERSSKSIPKPEPREAGSFAPLLDDAPVPEAAAKKERPSKPIPKPEPRSVVPGPVKPVSPPSTPKDASPMSNSQNTSSKGLFGKFQALPLWQQWAIILVVIALIGVAIFALPIIPLGEAPAPK
jgi:hypothetical protein